MTLWRGMTNKDEILTTSLRSAQDDSLIRFLDYARNDGNKD